MLKSNEGSLIQSRQSKLVEDYQRMSNAGDFSRGQVKANISVGRSRSNCVIVSRRKSTAVLTAVESTRKQFK